MREKLPVLYKLRADGSIHEWCITTDFDEIVVRSGPVDGAKVESRRKCYPKNVGRSNETSAESQAFAEAKSEWTKKRRLGYDLSEALARVPKLLPMLAKKFVDYKNKIEYPVAVQPKLNGVRCMAKFEDSDDPGSSVELISRGNKRYDVPHIEVQIRELLRPWPALMLDGELYIHNVSLQEINSLVRGQREDQWRLEYHVYDTYEFGMHNLEFARRRPTTRIDWNCRGHFFEDIHPVKTVSAVSETEIEVHHDEFVRLGYEGAIVRSWHGKYGFGKRSVDLLKFKKFKDDEFEIVGIYEGEGTHKGCIMFKCITLGGKEFGVTPKWPLAARRDAFEVAQYDPYRYLGHLLTVKYQGWSDDGVPYYPVGLSVRLTEDL